MQPDCLDVALLQVVMMQIVVWETGTGMRSPSRDLDNKLSISVAMYKTV